MSILMEGTQRVSVTEEDGRDRMRWRQTICCGDSFREQEDYLKKKKKKSFVSLLVLNKSNLRL